MLILIPIDSSFNSNFSFIYLIFVLGVFSMAYYDYYRGGDMMDTNQQWHESLVALSTQLSEVNKKLVIMELTAQVSELTKKVDTLSTQAFHCPFMNCQICGGSHPRGRYPINLQPVHFVTNGYMQQSNLHSNFYNSSWEVYHDYSWCNNQGPSPYFYDEPMLSSKFLHQLPIQEDKPSLEEVLEHHIRRMDAYLPKQE